MFRFLLALSLLLGFGAVGAIEPQSTSKINWLTNYDEAVNQSRSTGKPILLFFTGSDWCGWCHKLENEVLNTVEFADSINDKFIFVTVDFPLKSPLDPATAKQNKELQQKFDVRGYPTIILVDSEQKQLGTTGYRPGGAKAYADFLLKIVNDTQAFKEKVSKLETTPPASSELEVLYGKAKELCRFDELNKIIQIGMQSDDNRFFLLERYRYLAEEGFIHRKEAQTLRKQILNKDPENANLTQYKLAVIEFETFTEEMNREDYAPELAIAPLISYIEKFGEKDLSNLWRLNMIISQVYLDHSDVEHALKYVKEAQNKAPLSLQSELAFVIKNLESTLN